MQLKEPPLVKPDVNELHPDVNSGMYAYFCSVYDIADSHTSRPSSGIPQLS